MAFGLTVACVVKPRKQRRVPMKPVEGWCGWCRTRFMWTPTGPDDAPKRYCTKGHAEQARRARRKLGSWQQDGVCPTPAKKTYLSREAADRVLVEAPTKHKAAISYLCPCGFWHLGHVPKDVHSKERMEQQRVWLKLTEEQRQAIRERAYADKLARRAARVAGQTTAGPSLDGAGNA